MTLILDTSQIPAADRADAVEETLARTVVHVNIDFPEPAGLVGRAAITEVGDLQVCSVRSNATKVERTPRLARDELPPSIFLGVQITGSSLIVQGDREAVLRPGDLAFSDSTAPYTLLDGEGISQHFFRIPMASLALPYGAIRQLSAVTLSPGHPVADLAATYFRRLGARPDIFAQPGAAAVVRPSIELVRALITTHLDASALVTESSEATLLLRILEYTRAHLPEPGLNAAQIAAAHHISVRHLYNVLARGGVSLGDWMRTRRLEACRDELSNPLASSVSISSIARRHGFTDPSSFGRLFRAAYGLSPREWRAMSLHNPR
ncbi:MAG TPA: helix-turn-helix domain-containing protein [Streptosporangiaceae bacterium]|nr:helix-turn-helix domain-containing protein [Streptosporangiaceae bacterium]